jgi:nitrogen fixation protein NifZ
MNGPEFKQRFVPGQRVVFLRNVPNDGFYRHAPDGIFLLAEGERGEILNVGFQEEMHRVVYFVEFSSERVIGCFEEDLVPLPRNRTPGEGAAKRGSVRKGEGRGRNL